MEKILVIEDEVNIARMIQLELTREGYSCDCTHDGETGLTAALSGGYDLILLDLMLPKLDGFSVLSQLRERSQVAVVILTAKGDLDARVQGLDLGADDYLCKPFAMRELTARVRAALRRKPETKDSATLYAGDLRADRLTARVFFKEEELSLTRKEFELLVYFMEQGDAVCTREQILKEVWGYDYMGDTNLVDVYIRYLRSKIDDRFGVRYFRTVRGLGYAFGADHE
ncbi:MAG: response regulator transcription factor [Clostridia bacterium]|nr:response regulator transcription factor [Clostridia bacterium]